MLQWEKSLFVVEKMHVTFVLMDRITTPILNKTKDYNKSKLRKKRMGISDPRQ